MPELSPSKLRELILSIADRLDEAGQTFHAEQMRMAGMATCATGGEWLGRVGVAMRAAGRLPLSEGIAADLEVIRHHVARVWPGLW